jgi:peroxiredoxin Q/BCP
VGGVSTAARLSPGDPAPGFTLPDADGTDVSLADYRGRRVVVYFYPAAGTPGCTKQACDFSESLAELNGAGLDVLGVSPDSPAKLAGFRDAEGITFPLLSDADRAVMTAWGAFGEKTMYGRTVTRGDPLDVRRRGGRHDRRRAVQRPRHRPRGQAPPRARGLAVPGRDVGDSGSA